MEEHLYLQGPFSKDEVIRYAMDLCQGLQWFHKHNMIHRDVTDIYAFGVLINQMATGKMPHEMLPSDRRLRKIVKKCTQISSKKRYANCRQIRKQLDAVLPEDTSLDIRLLRKIPGFRTATLWKMILAVLLYLFALVSFLSLA